MCGSLVKNHKVLGRRLNQSQGRNPKNKIGISVSILKCSDCGLIYSNPLPIPLNIQDHYGIPPESYWKDEYFVVQENYFLNEINRLKSLLNINPGARSLDVGAGLGKAMIALSNAGFESFGLEPSEPFYKRAISQMKISPDKLKLGMVESLNYPENYFDFISFGAVLEHLYNPSESIQKAIHWLKPNGIIHIEVPSSNWLVCRLVNLYYKAIGSDYVGNISPMHIPYHLYEFDLQSFIRNGKESKYEVVFFEYFVCETYLPKYLDFILKPLMRWTNTGMQLSVWLKKC